MKLLDRTASAVQPFLVLLLLVAVAGPPAVRPVLAQSDTPAAQAQNEAQNDEGATAAPSAAERKRRAKEQRIADYLKKKEEKRLRLEQERQQREAARTEREAREAEARELETKQLAEQEAAKREAAERRAAAAAEEEAAATGQAASREPKRRAGHPRPLPRQLARAQQSVRRSQLGRDETVQRYLSLIDNRMASPEQLAAFGNFVADAGLTAEALDYYDVALRLQKHDPVLWVNVGTLHRQLGNLSAAAAAYSHALAIDANYALAHYNLGAVMDEMDRYESALEEYKIALTLDPNLGDPVYNPAAANNDRLLAVQLMLYDARTGSLGTPLVDVPGGGLQEP